MENDPWSLTPGVQYGGIGYGQLTNGGSIETGSAGGASSSATFFSRFSQGLDLGFKAADLYDRIVYGRQPDPVYVPVGQPTAQVGGISLTTLLLVGGAVGVTALALRKR